MKTWALALMALAIASPASAQSNPSTGETEAARRRGPCGDPWVTIALETVFRRVPFSACDVKRYNNGSWSSYAQLLGAVRNSYRPVVIEGTGSLAGKSALGIFLGGNLVAAGGGNLVAAGGGNLVAAGGGNLVAAGGGNIIMQQGSRLVSPGGGSFSLQSLQGAKPVAVMD